jgi:hypothetical protein
MFNGFRQIGKVGHGIKKFPEFIVIHIPDQTIRESGP